jgi:hypothetical protein
LKDEFGDGEIVFLEFSVDDTGRGLTIDEKKILFRRFSQAPKTHVNYGGSGLGLFISRELVELQGGQIGVASAGKHEGSSFSFYVKARRASLAAMNAAKGRGYSVVSNDSQAAYAMRSAMEQNLNEDTASLRGSSAAEQSLQLPCHRHALIVEDK